MILPEGIILGNDDAIERAVAWSHAIIFHGEVLQMRGVGVFLGDAPVGGLEGLEAVGAEEKFGAPIRAIAQIGVEFGDDACFCVGPGPAFGDGGDGVAHALHHIRALDAGDGEQATAQFWKRVVKDGARNGGFAADDAGGFLVGGLE